MFSQKAMLRRWGFAALAAAWVMISSCAFANDVFRPGLRQVAQEIAELARERNVDAIDVEAPDGPTAYGTGIGRILEEELKQAFGGSSADPQRPLRVTGSYFEEGEQLVVEFQLKDGSNRPIPLDAVLPLEGATVGGETNRATIKRGERRGVIQAGFGGRAAAPLALGKSQGLLGEQSFVHINQGETGVGLADCFLSVVVDGRPQAIVSDEKRNYYVNLRKGNEFQLRINNPFGFPIGVEFELDGVSSFALSQEKASDGGPFKRWIIPPKTSAFNLPGWYITGRQAKAFQIVDFDQGVAVQLSRVESARLGTLTAYVYRLKTPEDKSKIEMQYRQIDEPKRITLPNGQVVEQVNSMTKASLELVGAGRQVATNFSESRDRLVQAEEIAVLTIRYDKLGESHRKDVEPRFGQFLDLSE